jgi:hypothetical protein
MEPKKTLRTAIDEIRRTDPAAHKHLVKVYHAHDWQDTDTVDDFVKWLLDTPEEIANTRLEGQRGPYNPVTMAVMLTSVAKAITLWIGADHPDTVSIRTRIVAQKQALLATSSAAAAAAAASAAPPTAVAPVAPASAPPSIETAAPPEVPTRARAVPTISAMPDHDFQASPQDSEADPAGDGNASDASDASDASGDTVDVEAARRPAVPPEAAATAADAGSAPPPQPAAGSAPACPCCASLYEIVNELVTTVRRLDVLVTTYDDACSAAAATTSTDAARSMVVTLARHEVATCFKTIMRREGNSPFP